MRCRCSTKRSSLFMETRTCPVLTDRSPKGSGKAGNRITLKTRTTMTEAEAVVTVEANTSFKRYAPDSVKFADAASSKLSDVNVGDQLRARGEKSADGLNVTAQEVVFGTFVLKAGTIAAVDAEAKRVTVKERGTKVTGTRQRPPGTPAGAFVRRNTRKSVEREGRPRFGGARRVHHAERLR